jgi:hypothetical protein
MAGIIELMPPHQLIPVKHCEKWSWLPFFNLTIWKRRVSREINSHTCKVVGDRRSFSGNRPGCDHYFRRFPPGLELRILSGATGNSIGFFK